MSRDRTGISVVTPAPDAVLDVRGEMCPVPLMRTMVAMKRLQEGQILAVITDHTSSTQSIPENMGKNDHEVLGIEDSDGRTFRILIRR
jgi:TusA-related sulfurtransferase